MGRLIYILAICCGMSLAAAEIETRTVEVRRLSLDVGIGYLSARRAGVSITTPFLEAAASYAVTDRLALSGLLRHGVSPEYGFAAPFTAIEIGAVYAVTGRLVEETRDTSVDADRVLTSHERAEGGWRVRATLDQFTFNSNNAVYPFSGFGGAVYYEIVAAPWANVSLGAGADYLTNSDYSVVPISGIARLALRF